MRFCRRREDRQPPAPAPPTRPPARLLRFACEPELLRLRQSPRFWPVAPPARSARAPAPDRFRPPAGSPRRARTRDRLPTERWLAVSWRAWIAGGRQFLAVNQSRSSIAQNRRRRRRLHSSASPEARSGESFPPRQPAAARRPLRTLPVNALRAGRRGTGSASPPARVRAAPLQGPFPPWRRRRI